LSHEKDFKAIEEEIRKLRIEYDLYLSGQRRLIPEPERKHLDKAVRRYSADSFKDAADRFRYSSLVARYNVYCELWDKQMRDYEEGPRGAKRKKASPPPAPPPPAGSSAESPPAPPPPSGPEGDRGDAKPRMSVQIDVGRESRDDVAQIYERYVEAREQTGESAASVNFERFQRLISDQAVAISRKTGTETVEFEVKIADGKVKLVAKPKGKQ